MVKTRIIVTFQVEGKHQWSDCPFEEVAYLKNPHRHLFHVTAKKEVRHDDRDIEIIMLKRQMKIWLQSAGHYTVDFQGRSCEMIAKEYLKKFDLDYCSVLEDGENGAEVFKVEESKLEEYMNLSEDGTRLVVGPPKPKGDKSFNDLFGS